MTHRPKPNIRHANACPPCPSDASTVDKLVYWLGVGLGSGLPKRAPGTWGTLGGLLVAMPLMMLGFRVFAVMTVLACVIGIWLCERTSELMGVHDDPHIVWDEWAGMWIALLPVSYVFAFYEVVHPILYVMPVLAFVLFRFFDIVKPFPIGYLDRQLSGGLGIMLDDMLAGLFTAIIVTVAISW